MTSLVILGAGQHALVCGEAAETSGEYRVAGYLEKDEDRARAGSDIGAVLGSEAMLPELRAGGIRHALLGFASPDSLTARRQAAQRLAEAGFESPSIRHAFSWVSPTGQLGDGSVVLAGAVISARALLGRYVVINTRASVDHDCIIEDFVHLAPGSCLSGRVRVGSGTHVGTGAVVRDGITIGAQALIGAGSVVVANIPDRVVAYGNPCRVIGQVGEG